MTREEAHGLTRIYEGYWSTRRLGSLKQTAKGTKRCALKPEQLEEIRVSQAFVAGQLVKHFTGNKEERYRLAMWRRRQILHTLGRCAEVYDGSDAVASLKSLRTPRVSTAAA